MFINSEFKFLRFFISDSYDNLKIINVDADCLLRLNWNKWDWGSFYMNIAFETIDNAFHIWKYISSEKSFTKNHNNLVIRI